MNNCWSKDQKKDGEVMIDVNAHVPKYVKVKKALMESIQAGEFGIGAKIPSLHQLTRKHRVSDTTIKKALSLLVNDGVLRGEWGKGVYVKAKPVDKAVTSVTFLVWSGNKDMSHPYCADLHHGILTALCERNCKLEFTFLDPLSMSDEEIERQVSTVSTKGVVAPFIPGLTAKHLMILRHQDIPAVFMTKGFPEISPYLIVSDIYAVIADVVGRCAAAGKTKIALIGSPRDETFHEIEGAIEKRTSVSLRDEMVVRGDYGVESGVDMTRELLDKGGVPDLVIAYDEFTGYGALKVLRERGVDVPGETRILGVGGFYKYILAEVKLASVSIPFFEMGRKAATMLLDVMEGREPSEPNVTLPCVLEENDTFKL